MYQVLRYLKFIKMSILHNLRFICFYKKRNIKPYFKGIKNYLVSHIIGSKNILHLEDLYAKTLSLINTHISAT